MTAASEDCWGHLLGGWVETTEIVVFTKQNDVLPPQNLDLKQHWKMILVGGWPTPLKNMRSSVGMMKFPTEWKKTCSRPPTSWKMIFQKQYSTSLCWVREKLEQPLLWPWNTGIGKVYGMDFQSFPLVALGLTSESLSSYVVWICFGRLPIAVP